MPKVIYINKLTIFIAGGLLSLLFFLAILPEKPAKLLTSADGWVLRGDPGSKVLLRDFPIQFRQVRDSAVESVGGYVFRSWTPGNVIIPLELTSAPFRPTRFMSVAITGNNLSKKGHAQAYIECEQNDQRLEIFRGSVNVNVAEAIVVAPDGWCTGNARLKFISSENDVNVGVGSVFGISHLSYLKSSFIGRVPYFLLALGIFSLVMLAGSSLAIRLSWRGDLLPIAFTSLGAASLGIFYFSSVVIASVIPENGRWISMIGVILAIAITLGWSGREARFQAIRSLAPYARVWAFSSFTYFTILGLAVNNLGHWEPNYRFWPAIWSSDNELPWMFAEAIRHGWDLKGLFGDGWISTDRPPLMAGSHLMISDFFGWLQSGNDGAYLRGHAYNASAVILNALWVPAALWLLKTQSKEMACRGHTLILVLVACLPFVLFNTVYGWPKAFGAAFAMVAFGLAFKSRERGIDVSTKSTIILFFVLGAFSMLAHASTALFLAPLGMLFLWWMLRQNTRYVIFGFTIALALLGSWSLYKSFTLSSADPLTKYALTGDYGFGHPDWTLLHMLTNRYGEMSFLQWIEIKRIMLFQAFLPLNHSITQIGLNLDFWAKPIDKLRAWDLMLLSKGNVVVLFFILMSALAAMKVFLSGHLNITRNLSPFFTLINISMISWLLMVIFFLVPPIIPVWPQAALFGLALGGAVVVNDRYPIIFIVTLLAVLTYTGVVWILLPLQNALTIDSGAVLMLVVLGSWVFLSRLLIMPPLTLSNLNLKVGYYFPLGSLLARMRESNRLQMIGNFALWSLGLRVITFGAFLFTTYMTFRYIHQPLADIHAFRQTQTALTAFWMLKDGWALSYQTPVAGFPWSIPYEFPIYQTIVAALTYLSGFDLSVVGRFVSYIFLVACAWPAFALNQRLDLPSAVPWVFCALLWTSPINVYWGRTFMIETAALFFSLACIPYAVDLIRSVGKWRSVLLFIVFATAAVLQKATTGGPVLLFLMLVAVFVHVRQSRFNFHGFRQLLYPAIIIILPLAIGLLWSHYTDVIKMSNLFGSQLTSKALISHNFGSLEQKLDFKTWKLVVWERSLVWNAGGIVGLLLLILPWFGGSQYRRVAWISLAALLLFFLPLLIFTNLHIVHEYYQVSCLAFLLAALAIVIGDFFKKVSGIMAVVPIITLFIIFSNITFFNSSYGIVIARSLDELDPRSVQSYKVGRYLREHTLPDTGLVVFGQAYSSEIGFQAQRKSMTAPPWFKEYELLWKSPQTYLGNLKLSAVVICPLSHEFPNENDINKKLREMKTWREVNIEGCSILLTH